MNCIKSIRNILWIEPLFEHRCISLSVHPAPALRCLQESAQILLFSKYTDILTVLRHTTRRALKSFDFKALFIFRHKIVYFRPQI